MKFFFKFYTNNYFLNLAYTYPEGGSIMSEETLEYTY
jgi:hypothetical protein